MWHRVRDVAERNGVEDTLWCCHHVGWLFLLSWKIMNKCRNCSPHFQQLLSSALRAVILFNKCVRRYKDWGRHGEEEAGSWLSKSCPQPGGEQLGDSTSDFTAERGQHVRAGGGFRQRPCKVGSGSAALRLVCKPPQCLLFRSVWILCMFCFQSASLTLTC